MANTKTASASLNKKSTYINLYAPYNFKTDKNTSRTVQLGTLTTLKEICELADAGFSKFTEIEGYQIFKKPK